EGVTLEGVSPGHHQHVVLVAGGRKMRLSAFAAAPPVLLGYLLVHLLLPGRNARYSPCCRFSRAMARASEPPIRSPETSSLWLCAKWCQADAGCLSWMS